MPEVKQIDIRGIFRRATGHDIPTERTIICGELSKQKTRVMIAGNLGKKTK